MAYRYDEDLEFLGKIRSEDLDDLVYCLMHNKDGSVRLTEELTQHKLYKKHYPNHAKYWRIIAAEIQCFGANTFATILRGGWGVKYKEILTDICDKLNVSYDNKLSTENIETNLLMKILTDTFEQMKLTELQDLAKLTGLKNISSIKSEIMAGAFQAIFRAGGFKSYQTTVIIVNATLKALTGRGLSFATNATLTRAMAILTGPIGWTITSLWAAADIAAGPAYRVTIPAVIQVAALRQKYLYEKNKDSTSFS